MVESIKLYMLVSEVEDLCVAFLRCILLLTPGSSIDISLYFMKLTLSRTVSILDRGNHASAVVLCVVSPWINVDRML